MPGVIDPETMNAQGLPAVWSPVQWELTEEQRLEELEAQTTAALLWSADIPEAMLRLLLQEIGTTRLLEPPEEYSPEIQGEWDEQLATYGFGRQLKLIKIERDTNYLYLEYKFEDAGYWYVEIEPEKVTIARI